MDLINKYLKEQTHGHEYEYDYEGDMAKTQLNMMIDASMELKSMLANDTNLPEWVQSKITKAADYIDSARDYMKNMNKDTNGNMHNEPMGEETKDTGWQKAQTNRKDQYGNRIKNVARRLARQGMQAAVKDLKKGPEAGKRQVEEVEELDEALRHKIAGAVGQFIGNKIDPVHGQIMQKHGEEAYRQAAYHIRKTISDVKDAVSSLHDRLHKQLRTGGLATEEVEQVDEVSADVANRVAQARDRSAVANKLTPTQSRRLKMGDKGGDPDMNAGKALKSAMKRGAKNTYGEEVDLVSKYSKLGEAKYPGFRVRTTSGYPNLGPKLPRRGYGYVPQGLEDPRTGLPLGFSHPPKKEEPKKEEPSKKPKNS